jgi:hypothetical protein
LDEQFITGLSAWIVYVEKNTGGGSSRKGYTYGYSGIKMNGKNAVVVIKEMQIAKRGTSTA